MPKLPTDLSGSELRTVLQSIGFVFVRQKGSHMMMRRENPYARVVVPNHKTLRIGTLRKIIHDAGLTAEEFLRLLGRE